jgi:pre-mRNA-splicing factor SYF1
LKLYPEDSGKVWVKMSDYFIRLAEFDRARQVLEEAIETIDNAKDFGIIFSAYVKFEEEMITALANSEIRQHYEVIEEDNVDF